MKADKVTIAIRAEALSVDTLPGLLYEVADQILSGTVSGEHRKDDGDQITWATSKEPVEF